MTEYYPFLGTALCQGKQTNIKRQVKKQTGNGTQQPGGNVWLVNCGGGKRKEEWGRTAPDYLTDVGGEGPIKIASKNLGEKTHSKGTGHEKLTGGLSSLVVSTTEERHGRSYFMGRKTAWTVKREGATYKCVSQLWVCAQSFF